MKSLIITFANISQALKAERSFKAAGIPGALVPTPRDISASCSMSWRGRSSDRSRVLSLMRKENLAAENICEYTF